MDPGAWDKISTPTTTLMPRLSLLAFSPSKLLLRLIKRSSADLINGATAGTLYWSRSPGLFVNRETGLEIGASSAAPDFTGTVSEWYETLLETVNDVSARIHRKTLRGGANFIVTSPEVASILEFTAGFRAAVTVDGDRGTAGAVLRLVQLSKKLDVYVDPYFPRNLMLVGRRGGQLLREWICLRSLRAATSHSYHLWYRGLRAP